MKGLQIFARTSYLIKNGPKALFAFLRVLCRPELKKALDLLNRDLKKSGQKEPSPPDRLLAQQLIANYQAQAHDYKLLVQNESKQVYRLSPQWKAQVEERRKGYVEFLEKGDEDGLSRMLASFFRNSGSEGITEPTDYGRRATIANSRLILLVNGWYKKLCSLEKASRISCRHLYDTPPAGSPYLVHLDGKALHSGSLYYLAHVYEILRGTDLDENGEYTFVDLGAGYGGILKFLLQIFPRSKGIVFDIPQILVFSSYFLTKTFKDKQVGFSLDVNGVSEAIHKFDILLLPHWKTGELPTNSVDLFINTGSLPEMPWEASQHYLGVIRRAVKPNGFFYTFNRWETIQTKTHPLEHGLKDLIEAASLYADFNIVAQGRIVLYPSAVSRKLILKKKAN